MITGKKANVSVDEVGEDAELKGRSTMAATRQADGNGGGRAAIKARARIGG